MPSSSRATGEMQLVPSRLLDGAAPSLDAYMIVAFAARMASA